MTSADTQSPASAPVSELLAGTRRRRRRYLVVAASAGVGILVVALGLSRRAPPPGPASMCRQLERAGVVSECRSRGSSVEHGVPTRGVARFEVREQSRKAYFGTLAQFDSLADLERYLRAAGDSQRQEARKVAAATQVASEGRTRGEDVLEELVSMQMRNDQLLLAVHLRPVYGGPHEAARPLIEAIRAALTEPPSRCETP